MKRTSSQVVSLSGGSLYLESTLDWAYRKGCQKRNSCINPILNYFIAREDSGFGEGFNNKINVLKRQWGTLKQSHFKKPGKRWRLLVLRQGRLGLNIHPNGF